MSPYVEQRTSEERIDARILAHLASGHNMCTLENLANAAQHDSRGSTTGGRLITRSDILASIERLRERGNKIEDVRGAVAVGYRLVD